MSDDEVRPPTLMEMADYLAHYGVKGMKWGQIRRSEDGGGSVSIKARPTYTNAERRLAKRAVKMAKKSPVKAKALDSEGKDLSRLAKLNTPPRRLVNAFLGTKYQWGALAAQLATVAAISATVAGTGGAALPAWGAYALGAGNLAATAASLNAAYKVFFQNMKNNPKIRTKVKLSPAELAKFEVGRQFTKHVVTNRGSVKLSSMKGQQKIEIFDKEGRMVGGQTRTVKPPKKETTPKPAKA